jgi:hypothetical protein
VGQLDVLEPVGVDLPAPQLEANVENPRRFLAFVPPSV